MVWLIALKCSIEEVVVVEFDIFIVLGDGSSLNYEVFAEVLVMVDSN